MKPKDVISFLEKKKIDFEVVDHKEVYTATDAAKVTKSKEQEIVKVLVLKLNGKKFIMAVLPGNLAAKIKRIKSVAGAKELVLATEIEMKKATGLKPGSAPALGKLLKMKVYADKTVEKNKNIVFPAGEYTKSIKINLGDWVKLESPEILQFSVVPSGKKKKSKSKKKQKAKK